MVEATETAVSPYVEAHTLNSEHAWLGLDILKINRASLMAEARLIRRLVSARHKKGKREGELKRSGPTRQVLSEHRKGRLRNEARAAHLAHGYLRDVPYASMENPERLKKPVLMVLAAVRAKVARFSRGAVEGLDIWFSDA
ncbi:hypothetical protein LCGC14_2314820 [marine sediment metagenome]|uniref:Uncharacterized protein n=1 Tax=marine sediment metagenome TaxID=412755 RepID=A0A0F9D760_9ZZZZ